ncbi:ABC transporter permease [Tomitella fengzijianii]|uniref:ABC transporter permease n=1 Tax=Tomitella fengzijianii TaxID=2597660 RepID=A0A516WZ15_9ACTN|nr:ABC transporter permease [Tomitella fengzijianii]QDQ96073.1 ABC transporter permease [Tomitella fengzijianii]
MSRRMVTLLQMFALPILLIAAWWIISINASSLYFPSLNTILANLGDWLTSGGFVDDVIPSVVNLLVGYALAVLGGIAFGMLIGRVRVLETAFNPIITFARSIPPAAILPFFILAMGATDWMRITVIAVGSVWPTLLATIDGVRGLDPLVEDVTRIYKTSRMRRIFKVLLPAASPLILAGMKTSLAFSIILVVVSEMMASTQGIGHYIFSSQQYFDMPGLWAGTIAMGVLGYLLSEIFFAVERRVLAWKVDQS